MADSVEFAMFFSKHKATFEKIFNFLDDHPDAVEALLKAAQKVTENNE